MKKHYNIPVFITHSGCKNDCVFCNQKIITGQSESSGENQIRETIEKFIDIIYSRIGKTCNNPADFVGTEIAFFGGSFTGLDRRQMIKFLELANEYISRHKIISGIRISTRPDYISREIVDILSQYNVKSIELGIQSMFDDVLAACKRGCKVEDTIKACETIKSAGINLTGQMMLGLPQSDREKDIETAKKLVCLGIDCARIYPAVILDETELYAMYKRGEYAPLDLDEAVFRAKEIKKIFDGNNITILRMGLCSSDINDANIAAGAYHPAFGEIVESEIIYDGLVEELGESPATAVAPPFAKGGLGNKIIIHANKKNMSKVVGHKRKNIERLREKFDVNVVEDNDIIDLYKINVL